MKPKFDGYAAQYDAWFMTNDNLFQSELRLFLKALGFHDFDFYQTLLKNPMYTNEDVEDVVPGYQSGGYVAIVAHK